MQHRFETTLIYTTAELDAVMQKKHGTPHASIREPADAANVMMFLLATVHGEGLSVDRRSAPEIDGDNVLIRVFNDDYTEGWSERVQQTLDRLKRHIRT